VEAPVVKKSLNVCLEAILVKSTHPEELAIFYQKGFNLGPPKAAGEDLLGFQMADVYLGFERVRLLSSDPPGAVSIWFRVPSVEEVFKRLVELGAQIKTPPQKESWGETLAIVHDPDGNAIGLVGV
jgi:predicted enzyme related to lactoylglutathione lyase